MSSFILKPRKLFLFETDKREIGKAGPSNQIASSRGKDFMQNNLNFLSLMSMMMTSEERALAYGESTTEAEKEFGTKGSFGETSVYDTSWYADDGKELTDNEIQKVIGLADFEAMPSYGSADYNLDGVVDGDFETSVVPLATYYDEVVNPNSATWDLVDYSSEWNKALSTVKGFSSYDDQGNLNQNPSIYQMAMDPQKSYQKFFDTPEKKFHLAIILQEIVRRRPTLIMNQLFGPHTQPSDAVMVNAVKAWADSWQGKESGSYDQSFLLMFLKFSGIWASRLAPVFKGGTNYGGVTSSVDKTRLVAFGDWINQGIKDYKVEYAKKMAALKAVSNDDTYVSAFSAARASLLNVTVSTPYSTALNTFSNAITALDNFISYKKTLKNALPLINYEIDSAYKTLGALKTQLEQFKATFESSVALYQDSKTKTLTASGVSFMGALTQKGGFMAQVEQVLVSLNQSQVDGSIIDKFLSEFSYAAGYSDQPNLKNGWHVLGGNVATGVDPTIEDHYGLLTQMGDKVLTTAPYKDIGMVYAMGRVYQAQESSAIDQIELSCAFATINMNNSRTNKRNTKRYKEAKEEERKEKIREEISIKKAVQKRISEKKRAENIAIKKNNQKRNNSQKSVPKRKRRKR